MNRHRIYSIYDSIHALIHDIYTSAHPASISVVLLLANAVGSGSRIGVNKLEEIPQWRETACLQGNQAPLVTGWLEYRRSQLHRARHQLVGDPARPQSEGQCLPQVSKCWRTHMRLIAQQGRQVSVWSALRISHLLIHRRLSRLVHCRASSKHVKSPTL